MGAGRKRGFGGGVQGNAKGQAKGKQGALGNVRTKFAKVKNAKGSKGAVKGGAGKGGAEKGGAGKGFAKGWNKGGDNRESGKGWKGKGNSWGGKGKGESGKGKGDGSVRGGGNKMADGHTITLVQFHGAASSKTYVEHDSISGAMDGVCQMYEQAIKLQLGTNEAAKYTLEELWEFIDSLHDVACMVFNSKTGDYRPHNREWLKKRALQHLTAQVSS